MSLLAVLLLASSLTPQVVTKPGASAPELVGVQGSASGVPIPTTITNSISVSGTADTISATQTFNANSVCTASIALAGEQGSGFHLDAGTLDATLTPQYSLDNAAWSAAKFIDTSGTAASTIAVTNPNALTDRGIVVTTGTRFVRVCTTTYTSGAATGFAVAAFVQGGAAAGGGGGGSVTQGTSPWVVSAASLPLPTNAAKETGGNLDSLVAKDFATQTTLALIKAKTDNLDVALSTRTKPADTQNVAGPVTDTQLRASAVPTTDAHTTAAAPLSIRLSDGAAFYKGTTPADTQPVSGTFWQATQPVSGTFFQATQPVSSTQLPAALDGSGFLKVHEQGTATVSGTVAATQSGTWTVQPGNTANTTAWKVDGSAVTQPVSGTFWQATQPVSGTVTANQGGAPWSENISQINGTTILTGAGVTGAGSIRVTNATSDGNVLATANTGRLQVDVVTGGGSNSSVGTDGTTPPASETLIGATVVASPPAYTAGQMKSPTLDTMGNLRTASEINDGEFGTAQAKVLAPGQSPQPKDGALVVAISPNTPINVINIGTKSYTQLTAPTLKTMTVDPSGRAVTVLGPRRASTGNENAQVVAISPVPAPLCPNVAALSQTASTAVIPGSAGKLTYVCKVFVVSTTAQSVSLTEGTGAACGTGAAALAGSTTVANGMSLAANGGWVEGDGVGVVYAAKKLGDDLCLLQSGAGNVAGSISYVQF